MSGAALPIPPHLRFSSTAGEHLFLAAYGRLFDIPAGAGLDTGTAEGRDLLVQLATPGDGEDDLTAIPEVAPQSISLNVAATCNLACGYCYAGQGGFGGRQSHNMGWLTAQRSIDALFARADTAHPITIGFLGGEPFVNRSLIHRSVAYAAQRGASAGLDVRFSVTTNGTLLTDADHRLLRTYPFAVTVSIDGDAAAQDARRPMRGGTGSWERVTTAVAPLLANPGRARLAARATVDRCDLDLPRLFQALTGLGFAEVGFSPLRRSAQDEGGLGDEDWPAYLRGLTTVAKSELRRARDGLPIRLTNLAVALKEIRRGAASPYPCGAGGGYFSVAADGDWYACHRAIGDADYRLGDSSGLDILARRRFLTHRHVDAETDCQTCWAKYLCSGGCHHERGARTAASCNFIRDWLRFCLVAYCEGASLPARRP
jgi:uncharacterized protein